MKVIVCGDRNWTDMRLVEREMSTLPQGTTIIQGEARGADTIAKIIGRKLHFKVIGVVADWDGQGHAAGPIRNQLMLNMKPDLVLAFHDDLTHSKGTKDMVVRALKAKVPVRLVKHRLASYADVGGVVWVGSDVIELHRAIPRWLSHLVGGRKAHATERV